MIENDVDILDTIKNLLDVEPADFDLDDKIESLVSIAKSRLKLKLGGIEPPEEMTYIIIELVVKRFNRIGSEGLSTHSVEGESQTFSDDDFKEFEGEIQAFLDSQNVSTKGKVRFI